MRIHRVIHSIVHWTFVGLEEVGELQVPQMPPEYWTREAKRRELEEAFHAEVR